jgi:hypothetical protein
MDILKQFHMEVGVEHVKEIQRAPLVGIQFTQAHVRTEKVSLLILLYWFQKESAAEDRERSAMKHIS